MVSKRVIQHKGERQPEANGVTETKTCAGFSVSIIVVGFISGIYYRLIGLIRKRHDCITNSTRARQNKLHQVFQWRSLKNIW